LTGEWGRVFAYSGCASCICTDAVAKRGCFQNVRIYTTQLLTTELQVIQAVAETTDDHWKLCRPKDRRKRLY
jgi:hypothetical protein